MSRPRRWAWAMAMLLAAAPGCKRKTPAAPEPPPDIAPVLGPVVVKDLTPEGAIPEQARVDADALTRDVRNRLQGAGLFAAAPPDGGVSRSALARVRVELALEQVEAEEKGAARAAVRFRVETRPEGMAAGHWNEDVQAGAETTYLLKAPPDRPALYTKLASRTLADLVAGYVARQKIWRGGSGELRSALAADAGEMQIEAIRAVAERKLTAEVPTLLRLLSHDDEAVRDAALGALVDLRDRRAVSELAKQRSMRDRREMRKILDAIATLGGQEAAEYLSFVADAHEDEEIKRMAKQALDRLKRRSDGGPS